MKVSQETFRVVRWLFIGLLALQVLVVPWRSEVTRERDSLLARRFLGPERVQGTVYAPIFTPPRPGDHVNVGSLLVQFAITGGLLLLWLQVAKPEE